MLGLVNHPNDISLSRTNQSQAKFKSAVGRNLLQSWVNLTIVKLITTTSYRKSTHPCHNCSHSLLTLFSFIWNLCTFLTTARRYMFLPVFICLFVCVQHNSKLYVSILMKFSGINCYIKIWKWFIFERSRSKVKVKIDQKVKFT